MTDDLSRAVFTVCEQPDGSSHDATQRAFDHLKDRVEAVLATFERDGVIFGRICPNSERGDMAAVVASVLVREAAARSASHAFVTCPCCGNQAPVALGADDDTK